MTVEKQLNEIKKFHIGCSAYTLEFKKCKTEKKEPLMGQCNAQAEIISVMPGMSDPRVVDTFLHEVLHAIVNDRSMHQGLSLGRKDFEKIEEYFIGHLATGLAQFFYDNPRVCKLIGGLKREQ